jgi:hypothetical protein
VKNFSLGSLARLREQNLARLRQQRLVQHLHGLGPAPLGHFLDELAAETGCGEAIGRRLERYRSIDPAVVRALCFDQFAPRPPYVKRVGQETAA